MRRLSKSKIIAYRQCPKRLWLEIHRPDLRDDSGSEMVFAIGNRVGEVARQIYDPVGTGLLIDVDEIGWNAAYRQTETWLKESRAPLFEAALRIDGTLALADVMLPEPGDGTPRWRMIEVKSSTRVKDYQRDDLAVQAYIAGKAGIALTGASIAHVDNSFVYPGGGDYRGLLKEVDLTEEVRARTGEVEKWLAGAQTVAALEREPETETGTHCSDPFGCPFRHHCDRDKPQTAYPLGSFYRLRANKREEIEAAGHTDVREVPDDWLSAPNQRIKKQTIAGVPWFDDEGSAADLAPHVGTAYFLDFETIASGVPIWPSTRPYQQIPFQFSLHIVDENGDQKHEGFLDLSGKDPRPALAQSLVEHCGTEGPVFVYNADFEKGIMRALADRYPAMAPGLDAIIARVVDLLPIARNRYYHPAQHGSWSIKCVLPAAVPDLSYDQLEGICDGGMAMDAFVEATAPETLRERKTEIETQLHAYCQLDTLAMVRLWEVFKGSNTGGAC